MKLEKIVESRLNEMSAKRDRLIEGWSPYLNAVDKYLQAKEGRTMTMYEKRNVAQCLENALLEGGMKNKSQVFETTYKDSISFLGIQLPVISALLPSLVLNQIGIVQALDRRTGSVFYLDVKYGQRKGSLAADGTFIGAKTGHASSEASRLYATQYVKSEPIGAVSTGHISEAVDYYPVIAGSAVLTDGTETFTDDGDGNMVSDLSGGTSGTIDYTTGAIDVYFKGAVTAQPTISYQYNMEKSTIGVPEVNIELSSTSLTAEDFKLRAKYTMGAAIDLEKAHGLTKLAPISEIDETMSEIENWLNSVELCNA